MEEAQLAVSVTQLKLKKHYSKPNEESFKYYLSRNCIIKQTEESLERNSSNTRNETKLIYYLLVDYERLINLYSLIKSFLEQSCKIQAANFTELLSFK